VAVLDSGANVDCSAEELVQFARLGATYAECVLRRANPTVGLLSIGEEPEKGNAVTKEAHLLQRQSALNIIGNVILKFYEGVAPLMIDTLRNAGVDAEQLKAGLKHLDYSEHGGAPLLGVKGVSIIAHGKSSPRAVKNAIKVALQAVTSGMNEQIGQRLGMATESAA
jgi:glycerol-3-phosphate acyltransferase PlsX